MERKPGQWDADSPEPPRGLYVDTEGYVWKYNGDGWHGVRAADVGAWADDDGWQWHELTSGRNDDSRGIRPAPDFPWKVWTNG